MSALPVETTETTQSTGSVTTAASGIPASYAVPAPLVAALTRRPVSYTHLDVYKRQPQTRQRAQHPARCVCSHRPRPAGAGLSPIRLGR